MVENFGLNWGKSDLREEPLEQAIKLYYEPAGKLAKDAARYQMAARRTSGHELHATLTDIHRRPRGFDA